MEQENTPSEEPQKPTASDALTSVIVALSALDEDARKRVFDAVSSFFGFSLSRQPSSSRGPSRATQDQVAYSEDRSISPKDFLLEKQPKTDVHRVACLAYYLTHYRDLPHFKTLDVSKLNTEAAQPKFANAAKSVDNSTAMGYLAPATKGNKQLSAIGERFVLALPDMEAARAVIASARPRRKAKRQSQKQEEGTDEQR